jgi:hypothetical protein
VKERLILNRLELARIQKRYRVDPETGCWLWTGPTTPNGYAKWMVRPGERERVVHRVLWEHHHRQKIPEGLQGDHLCRVRLCVNPAHQELVTPSENTDRQEHANRLKTECAKGHPYDDQNTRIRPDGRRACRACDRERTRTR